MPGTNRGIARIEASFDDSWWHGILESSSGDRRIGCLALLDRRRILRSEVAGLEAVLARAQTDLEDRLREEWLACVQGEVLDLSLRLLSERACAAVDSLARELVFVRTALGDIESDLIALSDGARSARASA